MGIIYKQYIMMNSKTADKVKKRSKANDVFLTPLKLSKKQINMIDYNDNDIWFDPFKNNGSYYDKFPNNQSDNLIDYYNSKNEWTEIIQNKDFFTSKVFTKKVLNKINKHIHHIFNYNVEATDDALETILGNDE